MNLLQKARSHLTTLENLLGESRNLDATGSGGTVDTYVHDAPSSVALEIELRRGDVGTSRILSHPAFSAVTSAWHSIASHIEAGFNCTLQKDGSKRSDTALYGALRDASSGSGASDPPTPPTTRAAVLWNASRYSQTMRTSRDRWEWVRLLCMTWSSRIWRRGLTADTVLRPVCSLCDTPVGFPEFRIPCVCPVCLDTFCSNCYGGSWLGRLFGDRGCRRCSIIVKRYECFHGSTARLLEAGVYCIVSVTNARSGGGRKYVGVRSLLAPPTLAGLQSDEDLSGISARTASSEKDPENLDCLYDCQSETAGSIMVLPDTESKPRKSSLYCFPSLSRHYEPIGALTRQAAENLEMIAIDPKQARLLPTVLNAKFNLHCVCWLFLNVDAAQVS